MSLTEYLKTCQICGELNDDELAALADIVVLRKFKKGEILFFEGDSAHGFFSLVQGRVRIYKSSPDGREQTIHIINPGQIFAEVAIFRGDRFPAHCSALENSIVIFYPKNRFLKLLSDLPQVSLKVIGSLSAFLREYNKMVEYLSLKEVPERLAGYLLDEYDKTAGEVIHLRVTKAELARQLGTISETLSRNLRRFQDLGAVQVEAREIRILNPDILTQIASGEKP